MKAWAVVVLLALVYTQPAYPAGSAGEIAGPACFGRMQSRVYKAQGLVKKIDRAHNAVIVFHGPVAELMWPSMTMPFLVRDSKLLDSMRVGEMINFEFVTDSQSGVIISIE